MLVDGAATLMWKGCFLDANCYQPDSRSSGKRVIVLLLPEIALLVLGFLISQLLKLIVLLIASHKNSRFDLKRMRQAAEAIRLVTPQIRSRRR